MLGFGAYEHILHLKRMTSSSNKTRVVIFVVLTTNVEEELSESAKGIFLGKLGEKCKFLLKCLSVLVSAVKKQPTILWVTVHRMLDLNTTMITVAIESLQPLPAIQCVSPGDKKFHTQSALSHPGILTN